MHRSNNWGTKVCSNGPDHITKMVTMPKYGQTLKYILLQIQSLNASNNSMSTTKLFQMIILCCPSQGGFNEYQQPKFLRRNKKNNVYPCESQLTILKWSLKGSKLYMNVFMM